MKAFFAVSLTLRYTKVSCMPFKASMDLRRTVQADDEHDALRQACLCVERDLEEALANVNAINVSEVVVELDSIEEVAKTADSALWNPDPFDRSIEVPPHLVVRHRSETDGAARGKTTGMNPIRSQ